MLKLVGNGQWPAVISRTESLCFNAESDYGLGSDDAIGFTFNATVTNSIMSSLSLDIHFCVIYGNNNTVRPHLISTLQRFETLSLPMALVRCTYIYKVIKPGYLAE